MSGRASVGDPAVSPPPASQEELRHSAAAAEEAGVPLASLEPTADGSDPVSHAIAQRLSEGFCRRFGLLAVAEQDETVVLATARPADKAATRAAALMVGGRSLVVAAPPSDVDRAIARVFGTPATPTARPAPAHPAPPDAPEDAPQRQPLGEMLVQRDLLNTDELERALGLQQRFGDKLGEILMHTGVVGEEQISEALADQLELTFADLDGLEPDPYALALIPEELARQHRLVPLALFDDVLYVAMVNALDAEAHAVLDEYHTGRRRTLVTSASSIDALLERLYGAYYARRAADELLENRPSDSARSVLSRGQRIVFVALGILLLVSLVLWPLPTVLWLNILLVAWSLTFALYRLKLVVRGLGHNDQLEVSADDVAALDEHTLPLYTLLVPLYRETEVLQDIVAAISRLDYPPARLDVKLLLESDDAETIDAVQALGLPPHFHVVILPDAWPKTKPKALNYGLAQARGDYVVIYDAEDRPDPDQLKRVLVGFSKTDPEVCCLQCKLNYYNARQNLLSRWFTAEYSMWFDLVLPGLNASGSPIPLGGTSNHFRRQALIDVGAWDPFNVAEDADLGIRLHKRGQRTALVDSTTYEEANVEVSSWIAQRSRWIKGYIQTWLVHTRHPWRLLREFGLRRTISFHMIVGGTPAIFLLNPVYWGLTTLWTLSAAGVIQTLFPGPVFYAAGAGLYLGNFLLAFTAALGIAQRGYHDLVKYALASPLYWALMSIGAWKGLAQLVSRPHYWEKTTHGVHVVEDVGK